MANDCKIQSIDRGLSWAIASHLWDSEHTIERPEAPERPSNVINLMDALRDSLGTKTRAARGSHKKPASAKNGRRRTRKAG